MGTFTLEIPNASVAFGPWSTMPQIPITELYDRYSDLVLATALRVTGRSQDAEDVLQTVFLRLMKQPARQLAALLNQNPSAQPKTLTDPNRLTEPNRLAEAYLRRSATNASIDALRRRGRRAEIDITKAPEPATAQGSPELKERLRRSMAALSDADAELFALRYLEGYSNVELAEMLAMEVATVGTRLFRIRQTLQQELTR